MANTHVSKLDAVREQQDPPCTLLSQTSTIFPEGYDFKYEQDKTRNVSVGTRMARYLLS